MSLHQLPVEVLLLIESLAKLLFEFDEAAPSLKLSWVCQPLRAVFMPRFWNFVSLDEPHSLARLATLLQASHSGTYREHVKYLCFGAGIAGVPRIDPRLYTNDPSPSADDALPPGNGPVRMGGQLAVKCGPRIGEIWPAPIELAFNDPKRFFKLAGRKEDPDQEYESDETGSSVASEAEVEEASCTICHPSMHEIYRHRVKPDDYWLPGAVHSIGPLVWDRRTWGRCDAPVSDGDVAIDTLEEFTSVSTFVIDQLNFEAFEWSGAFPIPRSLITVLQEKAGTVFGDEEIPLQRNVDGADIYLPLSEYPEDNSMRGFMDFLLAAKKLKHLSAECTGVFITPCLLGVFAKLHSLHWDTATAEPDKHVIALSKLRSSLWQLAQAVNRPGYLLESADVQLLSQSDGKHADIAANLTPLADWLAQEELAALVAHGWNEQDERGPNEDRIFYPAYTLDFMKGMPRSCLTSAYENPTSVVRR